MEIKTSSKPVEYPAAVAIMEQRVADIRAGSKDELVWLVEHPPLYTAGTSAKAEDLLNARFPVHATGRGGQYTYHGPGQRVAYVMLDLKSRQSEPDIKCFVWQLEEWIICTLAEFGVKGERIEGRVGIWVRSPRHSPDAPNGAVAGNDDYKKIAAIGVRVRHWVTYHGISINVNPDLSHFNGIVPCGISDAGVTSFHDLGKMIDIKDLDEALQKNFEDVFQSAATGMACART
jgi:lipoyl(octanoyl) transferase